MRIGWASGFMIPTLPLLTATATRTMTFTPDELQALLDLIEFHDDWDECSEQLGVDVAKLYDKVHDLMSYATQG